MGIEAILRCFDHSYCNVGAVVGDTLIVGKQIGEHEAQLDGAVAVLQTGNVTVVPILEPIMTPMV